MRKYTWKYIQTDSNSLLWFHTMGLPPFYFVLVTLFTMQENYNHEFVNTLQNKYSENRPQAQWKQDSKILLKFKHYNTGHLIS